MTTRPDVAVLVLVGVFVARMLGRELLARFGADTSGAERRSGG